jgi:8-oxo-dGTP pyrophosphatase MutT (NUDIX family)
MREIVLRAFPPGVMTGSAESLPAWIAIGPEPDRPVKMVDAAVLVPLIDRSDGMTVLLTQRAADMKSHAGQISFPGGRFEAADTSPEDTALRETEEEIGLPRSKIHILGRLNTRETGSGFRVVPVVGLIQPPFKLHLHPDEVAGVFEVPLDFVMAPGNHRLERRIQNGVEREFYVMPYNEHHVWGLTARLLNNLAEHLRSFDFSP